MYTVLISQGLGDYLAIPVFPSRTFRHSIIYVRRDGDIIAPADFVGKRVGIPQWSQTAATYAFEQGVAHRFMTIMNCLSGSWTPNTASRNSGILDKGRI